MMGEKNGKDINTRSKESERHTASVISALSILDYLGNHERAAGLSELRRALGLNKSRVMRLCGTLEHMDYLKFDPASGMYTLGPRLFSLGKSYERQTPWREEVRSSLRNIVDTLQETASFHIVRGDKRFCVCSVESPHHVRFIMREGSEASYPYGSIWKVIMAWNDELCDKILAEAPFLPETPYSAVTRRDLEEVIGRTREEGYCHTSGDHEVGSSAIALPVLGMNSRLLGVLCLSGIAERMDCVFVERALVILRACADKLSHTLDDRI